MQSRLLFGENVGFEPNALAPAGSFLDNYLGRTCRNCCSNPEFPLSRAIGHCCSVLLGFSWRSFSS